MFSNCSMALGTFSVTMQELMWMCAVTSLPVFVLDLLPRHTHRVWW